MNISLKTLLIFCLVATATAQSTDPNPVTDPANASTTTTTEQAEGSSTAASTDSSATTPTTTQAEETSTATSTDSAGTTPTTTQATDETFTGSADTGTTVASTNTPSTTTIIATTTRGPCDSSPCIGGSSCEDRFGSSFACICRAGLIYDEKRGCIQTKVFPGSLTLDDTFQEKMSDKKTKEFQQKAREIEGKLNEALKDVDGYVNSTVLSLRNGSIVAEVQNFFDLSSNATSELVSGALKDFKFEVVELCSLDPCDRNTTVCSEQERDGTATCPCKDGYIKSEFTEYSCTACPNGKKAVDGKCEDCSFGLAGFNCGDPYLLVVVVVSTVLGALLFCFIVALIVVSCRKQKESSSPEVDFSSSYGNKDLHKPTGVPRIPRANPEANWKSNNLEMINSESNQSLVTRDRPESKTRYPEYDEEMNYRSQVPPAYSGYNGRGMDNGGVQNPYFRHDDDRMRRY